MASIMGRGERRFSNELIFGSVFITLAIWLGSKWFYGDWFVNPYKYVAKTASLSATILMCWAIILAARFKGLETFFGGLDKIYHTHKIVGRSSFWIILLHPLFLSCNPECNFRDTIAYFHFHGEWGFDLGLVSLILMVMFMLAAFCYFLPYHIWKRLHEWMGLVFLTAALHIVLIDKDINEYPLLSSWFYSWILLAALCYIYMRFLYRFIGPRFDYLVESVTCSENVLEIWLAPQGKKMHYHPGQFVYLECASKEIGHERHPYSIASLCNADGRIRLGIKCLGDHTEKLKRLYSNNLGNRHLAIAKDDAVILYGPYGRFSDRFLTAQKESIFIGAGIGITPFISMWDMALQVEKFPQVHLFYVNTHEYDPSFDKRIKDIAICAQYKGHPSFEKRGHTYELFQGHISADYIEQKVGTLKKKNIFICGPEGFRKALVKELKKKGVRPYNIITEEFNLRA